MTLETSFETGRDLLFWIWPLSTVTPFLKHGVRQPLKSVKSYFGQRLAIHDLFVIIYLIQLFFYSEILTLGRSDSY